MCWGPTQMRPSCTMPPPTPVPRITPKTIARPCPAPARASASAKQLASFSRSTRRPRRRSRSACSGRPLRHVVFEFLSVPSRAESEPGVPMPTTSQPGAEGRVVHDADSHVVETPDWLVPYADPDLRDRLAPLFVAAVKPGEETYIDQLRCRHADPAERAKAEDEIMLRKNWSAMGSFIKDDRPRALDLLGFRSQLVFNTFLNDYLCAAEHKPD